ncbi:imelysin family protein [Amorphus sp. 3PC139-8]|uniref:imelysin family protein n=1 Tax=Amorphus sp. 3PC139-8 TaxID=2735676 RepID=UPI00345CAAC4
MKRFLSVRLSAVPVVAAVAALAAGPALAQNPPEDPLAFKPTVARIVDRVIVPGYQRLMGTASAEEAAIAALCEDPSPEALVTARDGFADLVLAFGAVEPYRFGPAREDNRFERLFFWPDRRGIGMRQVQAILASEDDSATDVASLRDKSVAVQGLIALDYVLFDDDAAPLAEPPAGFRCRYAQTIAGAIATSAREILNGWTAADGYGALMESAGPDNPVYRSHGEAVQEFLRAAQEQLQIVGDMKIGALIGETPDDAKPKLAPFWRSGMVLPSMEANLQAVVTLQDEGGLADLLPDDEAYNAGSLRFQIGEAQRVLAELHDSGEPWIALAESPEGHEQLSYARIPIAGAQTIFAERYPAAFGLILGFNSLDGD